MKRMVAGCLLLVVGLAAFAAEPTITINSVRQRYPWNGALSRKKIECSVADYWVFVIPEYKGRRKVSSCDFVILTPLELLKRLEKIHEKCDRYNMYLTIKGETVIETREAKVEDRRKQFNNPRGYRNFSRFLNKWDSVLSRLFQEEQR